MSHNSGGNSSLTWLLILGVGYFALNGQKDEPDGPANYVGTLGPPMLSRAEAIGSHWEEVREHINGTEEVEACSLESGNCYELDADIMGGQIMTVHFSNGGWLDLAAEIDKGGQASDVDQEGRLWDFSVDMDSGLVDDAIQQWAKRNHRRIDR